MKPKYDFLAPDVCVQTHPDGRKVALVQRAARSRRDVLAAVERAREVLANYADPINEVKVVVDELSMRALNRAQGKRAQRLEKLS